LLSASVAAQKNKDRIRTLGRRVRSKQSPVSPTSHPQAETPYLAPAARLGKQIEIPQSAPAPGDLKATLKQQLFHQLLIGNHSFHIKKTFYSPNYSLPRPPGSGRGTTTSFKETNVGTGQKQMIQAEKTFRSLNPVITVFLKAFG